MQVRFRAVTFFRDLCKEMSSVEPSPEMSFVSVKGTSPVKSDRHKSGAGRLPSGEEAVTSKRARVEDAGLNSLSLDSEDCVFSEDRPGPSMRRSNSSSSSGCSSLQDSLEAELSSTDPPVSDMSPLADRRKRGGSDMNQATPLASENLASIDNGKLDSSCKNKKDKTSDKGLKDETVNRGQSDGAKPDTQVRWHYETGLREKRSHPQAVPNVSLSPVLCPRGGTSVSSGRNSSFDEADLIPPLAADVLVVSHGGFIKLLLTHFIEDLNCKVPGGKGHALRVCPNTGVSRFMVTLDLRGGAMPQGEEPGVSLTCLVINDKEHLKSLGPPLPPPSAIHVPKPAV